MEDNASIFTIGYQGYSLPHLVSALKEHDVKTLIDVRYDAHSRRPEFRKGYLEKAIEEAGVEYIHRPELGTPTRLRKRITDERSGNEVFKLYFERISRVNLRYVEAIADLARQKRVALMCIEREPKRCHRRILADFLAKRFRFQIVHLAPPRKMKPRREDTQLTLGL